MDSTDLPSSEIPDSEWNPHAQSVREDLLAACDHMRKHQPVVYHDEQQWYLFRHDDVLRVVEDHERFSNVVSTHLSVPNGMDPPEHTAYRPLIESFFDAQHMGDFEPRCRELSRKLLQELQGRSEVEVVSELAQPFALRVQCSFLSWPDSMEEKLGRWFASNQKAIREQDRAALARLELRVIMEEILRSTDRLQLSDTPVKAAYPASGYARLMLNWSWKG